MNPTLPAAPGPPFLDFSCEELVKHMTHLDFPSVKVVCGSIYSRGLIPGFATVPIQLELLALPWITRRAARHEYFMSDTSRKYSYGNKGLGSETYESSPFSPLVKHQMDVINGVLGTQLNVCFLNKYDDQHQHLGWHADDFPGMREDQPIVVISYGAEREIWLKDKRGFLCPACRNGYSSGVDAATWCDTCNEGGFVKSAPNGKQPADQRLLLEDGSLFIMPAGYQATHLHRIPKHDRPCGWRISLTFRSFQ